MFWGCWHRMCRWFQAGLAWLLDDDTD